jgi:uncharacterized membrane protein YphA (DoxX/SURF4 family)
MLAQYVRPVEDKLFPLRVFIAQKLWPIYALVVRLFMASIFYKSDQSKFQNYLNDDWASTMFLFEYVHPVSGLSPQFATVAGTAGELILAVFLAIGLFGLFSVLGLLIMTGVIQIAMPNDNLHAIWALLLACIAMRGSGFLSVDQLIFCMVKKDQEKK